MITFPISPLRSLFQITKPRRLLWNTIGGALGLKTIRRLFYENTISTFLRALVRDYPWTWRASFPSILQLDHANSNSDLLPVWELDIHRGLYAAIVGAIGPKPELSEILLHPGLRRVL